MTTALLEAIDAVAGDDDLEHVLTRIVAAAAAVTGARNGALGVRDSGHGPLRFLSVGPDPGTWTRIGAHRRSRDLLVVPVHVGDEVFGLLHLTDRAGRPGFSAEDEALAKVLADAAGHVVDHARADARSERHRRWLEAATDLAEVLSSAVPPERALDQVVRRARAASGARAAAVMGLPRTGPPVVAAYDGPAELVAEGRLQAAVAEARGPVPTVADPHVLVVRLRARLAGPSALVLVLPPDRDPAEELEMLAAYADQAGLALDRAQAVHDRHELALVAERERIARELHDVVVQRLFAAGLQLQTLRESPDLEVGVEQVVEALDSVIREIRGTVLDLREQDAPSPRREASRR